MAHHLLTASALLSATAIFAYVFADGWNLGAGILYPLIARPTDRDALFDSITSYRSAHQTGLVFAGLMVLLAVALAYSILPSRLLPTIAVMLACLLLRWACHEFRKPVGRLRRVWETGYACSSLGAAFAQGWLLSAWMDDMDAPPNTSGWLATARVILPALCGIGFVGGYGLLASCWLILKTEGAIQTTAHEVSRSALILGLLGMLLPGLYLFRRTYDHVIPQAASDPITSRFTWLGIGAVLLVSLLYLAVGYRAFRRKITATAPALPNHSSIASRRTSGAESSLHLS